MNNQRGFTLVEVIIAIVVLTVGLLGLVTTAALVTRMIARGQRSAIAATYAGQRMEQLRVTGCTTQASGSEDFYRGGTRVARNTWSFTSAGNSTWRVEVVAQYLTSNNRWRTERMESQISCLQ